MSSPFKVKNLKTIPSDDENLGTGRADYSTDIVSNVSVSVQQSRLSTITFSNVNSEVDATPTLPTTTDDYDSGWQAAGDYTVIRGHMYADQSGTIYIEQSSETRTEKTVRVQTTQDYVVATPMIGGFTEEVVATYVRVRFVPTVNPTVFVSWARLSN